MEPTGARHPPRLPRPLRPGALLPVDRGRHRRGSAARRELPQPGRLRHGGARRHRRLERDARVRAAEDPQRRDPEVPRRDRRSDPRDLRAQVVLLGLAGSLLGVAIAGGRHRGDSRIGGGGLRRRVVRPDRCRRRCRASRSACWCRCCSRSCRCSRSGGSSRCCCCGRWMHRRAPAGQAERARRFPAALVPAWLSPRRPGPDRRRRSSSPPRWWRSPPGRRHRSGSRWSSAADSPASRWCCMAPARCSCARSRPLAATPYFPLRHAVVSLRRPGNQTRVILLAVGLGSFFVLGVRALQANLLDAVLGAAAARRRRHVPDRHPAGSGRRRAGALPQGAGISEPRLIPVLRARVTGVRGSETESRELRGRARPRRPRAGST